MSVCPDNVLESMSTVDCAISPGLMPEINATGNDMFGADTADDDTTRSSFDISPDGIF
jgi:hypothetical protein